MEEELGYLIVVLAALAAFAFGAAYYMVLSKPWMAAAGVPVNDKGQPANGGSPLPYAVSFICILLVAGMMRHMMRLSGLETVGQGLMAGLGIGLFIISPWITLNNLYSMRPFRLSLIDGGYATIGCGIIGLVLTLF